MKILVLGGDGFCGWPTALHLSAHGHDVTIVDNLTRRAIDAELDVQSLTPIRSIDERLSLWKEKAKRHISFKNIDIAHNYHALIQLLSETAPDAIVHFAEQRAAPYSMKTPRNKRYTVENNILGTHNLLCALVEANLDTDLVHLGTMGVYGYAGGRPIPEGYLTVTLPHGETQEIVHPYSPGSVYHATKCLDNVLFHFYNRNDGLRVTDLHQGIVWGTQTKETELDPGLINRFDYDGDYGTVLNRFLVEAAVGHPLTVHGTGGQTRAFIHITDTVQCVRLAIENPPAIHDRVRILNQMTEVHRVRDLAKMVSEKTGAEIDYVENPRLEADENELLVENQGLQRLGLEPVSLQDGLMREVLEVAERWRDRVDLAKIPCTSKWRSQPKPGETAMETAAE